MSAELGPGSTPPDIALSTERTQPETAQEIMDYLHGYVTSDPESTRVQVEDINPDVEAEVAEMKFGDKSIVTAHISDKLVSVEAFAIDPRLDKDVLVSLSGEEEPNPKVGLRLTLLAPGDDQSETTAPPKPPIIISRAYIDIGDTTADNLGRSGRNFSYQLAHYQVESDVEKQIKEREDLALKHPVLHIFAPAQSLLKVVLLPDLKLQHLKAVKDIFAAQPRPKPAPRQ